jgi:tetratricopeptide (TPR) repeat protein
VLAERALLVELLLPRGHVLGRIADYEHAAGLAELLVCAAPDDGAAWLARARTRATFHRFAEALADLDAAGRRGADQATPEAERAAILQAVVCYAEALVLRRTAAERRPDFTTLGALAVLEAERGEVAQAERLFTEARRRYRGVSPFPVASLDFRRGLMWLGQRDLHTARAWFDAAVQRVPAYAPALGHLAEVDAALGARDAAIDRLRPLAASSDAPEYAASLASVLSDAGQPLEAEPWRRSAAARYDELVVRHPEAFVDHAAEFWLTVGGDRPKGLQLVVRNHVPVDPRAPPRRSERLVACRPRHVHTRSKGNSDMTPPHRPGLQLGARTEFFVIGDVIPGHEDALRQVLAEHINNPLTQAAVDEIGTLHEARFVLLDGGKRLVFCSSFDGSWDEYIGDFATTAIGQDFDQTWAHAHGYPGVKSPAVKDWFAAHQVEAGNFVCGYPEPTVKQVWKALALQKAFQQVLDTPGADQALQQPALKPLLDMAAD